MRTRFVIGGVYCRKNFDQTEFGTLARAISREGQPRRGWIDCPQNQPELVIEDHETLDQWTLYLEPAPMAIVADIDNRTRKPVDEVLAARARRA